MRNRLFSFLLAMALVAGLTTFGCSSKPPETAKKAVITDVEPATDSEPAEEVPAPDPNYEDPQLTELDYGDSSEEAPAPAEDAVTYNILPGESTLMWIGYGGVMGSMEGGFSEFTGTIDVAGGNMENTTVNLTVNMNSVFSDAKALTKKLRSEEFFETEKFPEATFKSTSVKKDADGYVVTGNLNLHGAEKSIGFPAEISVDGNTLTATAEFTFDRHAWGVDYDGTGDNFIKDDVLLRFEIIAKS